MNRYPDPGDDTMGLCGEPIDHPGGDPDCPDCEQWMLDLGLPELT